MSRRYQYLDCLSTELEQFPRIIAWLSAGMSSGMLLCVGALDLHRSPEYFVKKSIKLMKRDGMGWDDEPDIATALTLLILSTFSEPSSGMDGSS